MEFHLIKLNVNGTYLSFQDTDKHRFLGFKDKVKAMDCVDYVSSYRSKYGIWPVFDRSKGVVKVERIMKKKTRPPERVKCYLDIVTNDLNTIEWQASRTNTSYFYVLDFEAKANEVSENINMYGMEIDPDPFAGTFLYRDLLEFKFKCE
tara:strand:+ start:493 stop:939 length:447 start_codon:yes stop_codon:yes gene_type:complete